MIQQLFGRTLRDGDATILALGETIIAVSIVFALSAWMENFWYLAVWSVLGWTLLLRTPLSTRRGVGLFAPICESCSASLEHISKEGDFDFEFDFMKIFASIVHLFFFLAIKALLLLGLLLTLLFGSLYAKTAATLWTLFTAPWTCLKAIPGNWKKAVFCLDLSHPLEFVPGYSAPEWTETNSDLQNGLHQNQISRPYPRVADVDIRRLWKEMMRPAHRIHVGLFFIMILFLFGCYYLGRNVYEKELSGFMYIVENDITWNLTGRTWINRLIFSGLFLVGVIVALVSFAGIAFSWLGASSLLRKLGLESKIVRTSLPAIVLVIVSGAGIYLSWDVLVTLFSRYLDMYPETPDPSPGWVWPLVFATVGGGFWISSFLINRIVQSPLRLLLYVPAFMYRVALKASAITYFPLIWIFYHASRSHDVSDDIEHIQKDKLLRVIRAVSVVTIIIIVTKTFLYSLSVENQNVYGSLRSS